MQRRFFSNLLLGLLSALLVTACDKGIETPEAMANELVSSLNRNDRAGFESLVIKKTVMAALIEKADIPMDLQKRELENLEEEYKEVGDESNQSWNFMISNMKSMGLSEGNMKVDKVEVEEEERKGTRGAKVKAFVSAGNHHAMIEFTVLHHVGWHLLPDVTLDNPTPTMAPDSVPLVTGESPATDSVH